MKAIVAHPLWSPISGGILVAAYAVKTFLEAGYEVAIASIHSFGEEEEKYKEWFGIDLSIPKVYSLLPKTLPIFSMYQEMLSNIPLKRAVEKEKPDVIFVDNEFYISVLEQKEKIGFKLLEYIHFPLCAVEVRKEKLPEERWEALKEYLPSIEIFYRRYKRGWGKYYFKLWLRLSRKIARKNPFEAADVVITNSKYIGRLVNILWGGDAVVLYPPVRIKDFSPCSRKPFEERDNAIVMISRVVPEKRIEDAIDAVALTETKPVLRVVGGIAPAARNYKTFLERRAREKGVKIEFYPNIPRSQLVHLVTSSRAFVHTAIGEPFGIAVVEGMAAGCPAIVHRSGGPYEDILDYGRYGLTYQSVEELAEKIDELMQPESWRHYHKLSLRRAPRFSEEEFAKGLLEIVES